MRESEGGRSASAQTPFESMTHAELSALLSSASMETAMSIATKLTAAAGTIKEIGDDLKLRIGLVKWDGEAGDAFREWGNRTANATLHLGDYAQNAATWMGDVSQAIAEAHAGMPDLAETENAQASLKLASKDLAAVTGPGASHDPDSRTTAAQARGQASAAQTRIETTHAEAARQMRKLAETYVQSGTQINVVEPPTFPPPAQYLGDNWQAPTRYEALPDRRSTPSGTAGGDTVQARQNLATGSTGSTAPGTGGGGTEAPGAVPGHSGADGPVVTLPGGQDTAGAGTSVPQQTGPLHPGSPQPGPDVGLGIDTVAAPPAAPGGSVVTPPGAPPAGRPDGGVVPPPVGVVPPAFGGAGLPGTTGPGRPGGTGTPGGTAGGRAFPGTAGSVPPGQGGPAARGGVMPRQGGGIVGGRPVAPSGRTGGIPRGTVIGGEGGVTGGPMGRGGGAGMGGSGAGGSASAAGRRPASESGGVVGGRSARTGSGTQRPFTPGGSGLVRGEPAGNGTRGSGPAGTGSGAGAAGRSAAPGGPRTGRRRDDTGRERPDYLSEDEETWQRNSRRVVPPVID